MTVKLKLKFGNVEIDYEGEEAFLKAELDNIVNSVIGLQQIPQTSTTTANTGNTGVTGTDTQPTIQLSQDSVAQRMDVKSGADLTLAAAAYLTFVDKKQTFTRKEILGAMQAATSFYKDTHRSHLGESLTRLNRDNKLVERSRGVYVLHPSQKQPLEALLANS